MTCVVTSVQTLRGRRKGRLGISPRAPAQDSGNTIQANPSYKTTQNATKSGLITESVL